MRIVLYLAATGFQVELDYFDVSQIQLVRFSIPVACLVVKSIFKLIHKLINL